MAFLIYLFYVSKYLEFGDTVGPKWAKRLWSLGRPF